MFAHAGQPSNAELQKPIRFCGSDRTRRYMTRREGCSCRDRPFTCRQDMSCVLYTWRMQRKGLRLAIDQRIKGKQAGRTGRSKARGLRGWVSCRASLLVAMRDIVAQEAGLVL